MRRRKEDETHHGHRSEQANFEARKAQHISLGGLGQPFAHPAQRRDREVLEKDAENDGGRASGPPVDLDESRASCDVAMTMKPANGALPSRGLFRRTVGRMQDRLVDALVIGAGQAGLGTAYWLRRLTDFKVQVVDGAPIGESWSRRWDSLTLFTPRRFSGLPSMPFPKGQRCPSRTEMARYLTAYAARFELPVSTGVRVHSLNHDGNNFRAVTSAGTMRARQVIIATGPFHLPYLPSGAQSLHPGVWQSHSASYRRPADVPGKCVVVVGGGNSAAQIAVELAATHDVTVLSPANPWYLPERVGGVSIYWWLYLSGALNAATDSRLSRYVRSRGDAIIGTELRRLSRAGHVRIIPHRVMTGSGTRLYLADGSTVDVERVLWCTGFRPDTSWVDVPGALDNQGAPRHSHGASPGPGLHWMGLPWQTRLNSSIIDGVDRDARATVRRVVAAAG